MPGLDAAGVSAARRTGPGKTIQNVRSAYHSRSLLGQHTACRIGVIRVIEDQITTLRPYNARYTGDPRSIFRKRYTEMITRVSPDLREVDGHGESAGPATVVAGPR